MTTAGTILKIFVHIEHRLRVASHDLLGRLERICLASQLLSKNTKSQTVHLKFAIIHIAEELLLFRHQGLSLHLTKCRVFMFKDDCYQARLQGRRSKAIEAFVAPESCGRCKGVSEDNFHTWVETTAQQGDFCPTRDGAFCRYQLVDDRW